MSGQVLAGIIFLTRLLSVRVFLIPLEKQGTKVLQRRWTTQEIGKQRKTSAYIHSSRWFSPLRVALLPSALSVGGEKSLRSVLGDVLKCTKHYCHPPPPGMPRPAPVAVSFLRLLGKDGVRE